MIPSTWKTLTPHAKQCAAYRSDKRFVILAAGRGSGKTEISRRKVVRHLPIKRPWPDPLYFYALPTFDQARRVAWEPIKNLIPKHWIKSINESRMCVETVFGSKLYVIGMDKPERAEGVQWDGGVIDESSDQKPKVFDKSILPALSHRNGWCWRIGVPKRQGIGAVEFKEVFDIGMSGEDPHTVAYCWPSSDIIPPEQVEIARAKLDKRDFNEQYNASWETAGGGIFHAFDFAENVSLEAVYNPNEKILIGSDFNVDPMSWVIGHKYDNSIDIFDEISLRNANTQGTLDHLYTKYGTHNRGWLFCGDATAKSRKTSAAKSDYVQICNDARFVDKKIEYLRQNPPLADRFAATNAMLRNAKEEVRLRIHPRCKTLINDLQQRSYKEGTNIPDDSGNIGHISDALGYAVFRYFRLQVTLRRSPTVIIAEG